MSLRTKKGSVIVGIEISCDFCGRELAYSSGWQDAGYAKVACANCASIFQKLHVLTNLKAELSTLHNVKAATMIKKEVDASRLECLCTELIQGIKNLHGDDVIL